MELDALVIESTRKCNMKCPHCLRGKSETVYLNPGYLNSFIVKNNIERIRTITFTGGEPSLAVEIMQECLEIFKRKEVEIGSYDITTNAKVVTDEFIKFLIDLHLYCTDNGDKDESYSTIRISTAFHEKVNPQNIQKLLVLRTAYVQENSKNFMVIKEGRGKTNYFPETREEILYSVEIEEEYFLIRSQIYLNCDGNIINGCDWSFKSQKNPKTIICNYKEDLLSKVTEYNERNEEFFRKPL